MDKRKVDETGDGVEERKVVRGRVTEILNAPNVQATVFMHAIALTVGDLWIFIVHTVTSP